MSKMSDKEIIKNLRRSLYYQREEEKRLRSELLKADRKNEDNEAWLTSKLEWYLKLLKDGETPCLKYLVRDVAIQLGAKLRVRQ